MERPGEICSKPYQGVIIVKNRDRTREITRFTTDAQGEFKVNLAPGSYLLTGNTQKRFPFLKEQLVLVEPNKFTEVNLNLDTGIR